MTFYWWDDAFAFAFELAAGTKMPHRVSRGYGGWLVELADRAVLVEEPCS